MTIKAVLFDLDGTLLDTAPDFEYVLNQLRKEEGLGPLESEVIRQTVSNGARALVTLGFDIDEDDKRFESLRQRLLESYLNNLTVNTRPFPGILDLLAFLKSQNIAWGIATNKPELYTTPIINGLKLSPDCTICPDHVTHRKPHPESMVLASNIIGCNTEDIIYVGDHRRDIDCGNRANCTTIAVNYGYIDSTENINDWGADHIVEKASDITSLIKNLYNHH